MWWVRSRKPRVVQEGCSKQPLTIFVGPLPGPGRTKCPSTGPSVQDASERDDFAQCRPNITVQIRDHCVDLLLRGCSVGVAAGLDHPSTDASAREDLDVPVDAEDADILEPRRIVAAISATVATVPRGNSGLPTTTSAPRRTRTRKIAPPIPAPAVTTTIRS